MNRVMFCTGAQRPCGPSRVWRGYRRIAQSAFAALVLGGGWYAVRAAPLAAQAEALADGRELAIVLPPLSPDLAARLHGQTADLAWRVALPAADDDATGDVGVVRLRDARAQAQARGARVAIWVEEEGRVISLQLFDSRRGRLLSRSFPTASTERSASYEALALAVRASLQALSEGDAIGTVVDEPVNADATEPDPGAAPPASVPAPPVEEIDDGSRAGDEGNAFVPLGGTLAFVWQLDGATRAGLFGLSLEPQLRLPPLSLGVRFTHSLFGEVRDARTQLDLLRRSVFVVGRFPIRVGHRLALFPGVGIGVVQHVRRTARVVDELAGTRTSYPISGAALVSVDANVLLFDTPSVEVALVFTAGFSWLWAPPVLRYEYQGTTIDRDVWPITPILGVGFALQ